MTDLDLQLYGRLRPPDYRDGTRQLWVEISRLEERTYTVVVPQTADEKPALADISAGIAEFIPTSLHHIGQWPQ